jgi:DNA-binding NarL/FixJ family response regulator
MHLIFSGNLPDRFDAHQPFQSNLGFEGTRVPLALSSFAHGSAVLSSPAEPEKSNLGYCPKFGVHFSLTGRELGVLALLARGKSNKEIGASLFISETTVKGHLRNIFTKLNVLSRTEAITVASRRGLVQL